MPEDEEWRAVVSWEGFYEVSSLGRVRSLERQIKKRYGHKSGTYVVTRPAQIVAQSLRGPYLAVNLNSGERRASAAVHVLVCMAFHGPRRHGHVVAHWDGAHINNRSSNLRWATPAENVADSQRLGRIPAGDDAPGAKLSIEQIQQILASEADAPRVRNGRQAWVKSQAAIFGVAWPTIYAIWRGDNRRK